MAISIDLNNCQVYVNVETTQKPVIRKNSNLLDGDALRIATAYMLLYEPGCRDIIDRLKELAEEADMREANRCTN